MSDVKSYVVRDCMDSEGEFLKAGTTPTLDKEKEHKVFDIGNVEEFDKNKHDVSKDENESLKQELKELKKTLEEVKAERNSLQKQVKSLEAKLQKAK